ncbi:MULTISPECIES: ATP-dependent sacrificial sulfur transferase LarE [unclassified Luteococcus]|uniref:ATP-dependent sacrificial sulfur transferase LarE n=1 Tax=unclassified Luteococcus TaxID=2639923 RepID=UPI00313C058A
MVEQSPPDDQQTVEALDWAALDRLPEPLMARVSAARAALRCERLAVAFSGGVDSAVLLALAVATLGPERVVAVLGVSDSLAPDERTAAHGVAVQIGVVPQELVTREMDNPAYRSNGPDRCYFCKDELFTRMRDEATRLGVDALAYGENADDALRPDRPGSRAATEHRVLRPLAEAGMTKADVREVARALGLRCAEKPAAPCLASRIPHFSEVLPEKLAAVARAEEAVRDLGFSDCRVRHHDELARIELPADELQRALEGPVREELVARIKACGFHHVSLDLEGIKSGTFTLTVLGNPAVPSASSATAAATTASSLVDGESHD